MPTAIDIKKIKESYEVNHRIVTEGLKTFIEVGTALLKIKTEKLYKAAGYKKFADYTKAEHDFSDRHARYLMTAAKVAEDYEIPNERVARALARVPDEDRSEVFDTAVERQGTRVTHTMIEDVAIELSSKKAKKEGKKPRPDLTLFKTLTSEMQRVGVALNHLANDPSSAHLDFGQVKCSLQTAWDFIKDAIPEKKCPECKGEGCSVCRDIGWMPKSMHARVSVISDVVD